AAQQVGPDRVARTALGRSGCRFLARCHHGRLAHLAAALPSTVQPRYHLHPERSHAGVPSTSTTTDRVESAPRQLRPFLRQVFAGKKLPPPDQCFRKAQHWHETGARWRIESLRFLRRELAPPRIL